VTDYDTGLQWEQKTDDGGLHDTDYVLSWSSGGYNPDLTYPDGGLFMELVGRVNACTFDGVALTGGFAGHCDWRIPAITELVSIVEPSAPGCGTVGGSCVDETVFGPLRVDTKYWSSTVVAPTPTEPNLSLGVDFSLGTTFLGQRQLALKARVVRTAL